MLDLYRLGNNPFDPEEHSVDKLSDFGIELLGRMTADDAGGQLAGDIAALATALDGLEVAVTSETTKLGVKKARTAAKAAFRTTLPARMSRIHGEVVSKYGQDSPEMEVYFSEGRDVFSKCAESLLDNKLKATRDALAARETADPGFFDEEILTLANTLVTEWAGLYGAATTGRSQHGLTASQRRAAALALCIQLYKAVLRIASIFAGQRTPDGQERSAERIAHYCPQHLLEGAPAGAPNPPVG